MTEAVPNSTQAPAAADVPLVSVIILNYNGARWLEKCLGSLKVQTIFDQIEILVADNQSTDGSDRQAADLIAAWPNARFMQNGGNLGFSAGNNAPARTARGRFLFFLNNDAWLEPDCLEKLVQGVLEAGATGGNPLVLNYDDDTFQSLGAAGFDPLGFLTPRRCWPGRRRILMPEGCGYLIERDCFNRLGGFDASFFMYAEEMDLSVRVWLAGGSLVAVPGARMHHRQAANVNPKGGAKTVEFRTSDRVRYLTNRNNLWVWLKAGRHLLLVLAAVQALFLAFESLVACFLLRDRAFVRVSYWGALADTWRLRSQWLGSRREMARHRVRGDLFLLRFLSWRLNRWGELRRMFRLGLPKVSRVGKV